MNPSPILPPHSLDQPGVVKIALGAATTEALAVVGPHVRFIPKPFEKK
jgi:hypothetical protein